MIHFFLMMFDLPKERQSREVSATHLEISKYRSQIVFFNFAV